ncbi:3-hydroxyacyl-CoA dehydrogenase NAD-binding domain-containing protein, partial [Clostridioides difficile]|nr:3-hydroxyacyl-CoA dehydrogenase NAD-binding domain-containing protein [Clostridioides difficile]
NAHWLNPALLMPLVEISRSDATGQAVVDALAALLERGATVRAYDPVAVDEARRVFALDFGTDPDTLARLRVPLARRVGAAELRDLARLGAA